MVSIGARRSVAYAAIGLPIIGFALMAVKSGMLNPYGDNKNYKIVFEKPAGWKELPHGPQTLFLYRDPKTGLLLRGAVNQMVSEVNPTPELDTDGIAQYYIDRTDENMKEWTAEMGDKVPAKNTSFRLIHRERPGKAVTTAYAVKGNTTLLVSISGNEKEKPEVGRTLPKFKQYLSTIALVETKMDD